MPDMEHAVGEQPQQTDVPAGAAEAQRQEPVDFSQAIDSMTDAAEISSLLFGETPLPSAAPASVPVSDTEAPTPAEPGEESQPPAGEQPQEEATEPQDTPQEEPQAPTQSHLERISLKSLHPDERVLIAQAKEMVREGKAASFVDAFSSLTQKSQAGTQEPDPQPTAPAPAPQEQTQQPAPPPAVQPDQNVAQITQEIADLRAQRKAAIEEFDRPTEIELTSQIEDKLAELSEAKAAAIVSARETQSAQQAIQSVIEDIYVDYPEAEDPKSFFSYRMTQEIESYESTHGSIARHPQQLKVLAAKVAAETGQGKPPATPATKPQPAPVQPRQTARPLGSAAPGSAAGTRVSPDQIQQFINSANEDDLRMALFGT